MARSNKSGGGGGYSNPMQDHHKKARQKELQRNKQKRTKERNEKALETKTIKEVREEIQKLEKDIKRHHHGQQQKSNAEHRLARLQKELKLLQEAAEAARKKAETDADARAFVNRYRSQPNRPLTELDDPRKSVYYDPVMNPYGAPPPGKPRLYHRRYGGVTQNPHEAVVPGEEPPPPPPPPPPRDGRNGPPYRPRGQADQRRHPTQQRQQDGSSSSSRAEPTQQRQPLHLPPPNPPRPKSETVQTNNDRNHPARKASPPPAKKDKSPPNEPVAEPTNETPAEKPPASANASKPPVVPSLPAPSAAVQRTMRVARNKGKTTKRGAALADIWASTEEVEYERNTNLVDLEADDLGTAQTKTKKKKKKKDKKKKKKPPLEFYYRDTSGTVQGPFSKAQMRAWMDAGYFPASTRARTNRMDPDGWVPMGDLPALKADPEPKNNSLQDRIAALKGDSSNNNGNEDDEGIDVAMQARIAAMRADLMGVSSTAPNNTNADESNDSVQDRIAALKRNNDHNDNDDEETDPSMQARIAAMRADLIPTTAAPETPNEDAKSVQDRIAVLRGSANNGDSNHGDDDDEDHEVDPSMQARIAAMRADLKSSAAAPEPSNDSVQDRIADLRGATNRGGGNVTDNGEDDVDPSMQARIAAMRADLAGPSAAASPFGPSDGEEVPPIAAESASSSSLQDRLAALRKAAPLPPSASTGPQQPYQDQPSSDGSGHSSLQDRIAALRKNAPPPPPPPPPAYPVDKDDHYSTDSGPSAYPLGDADDNGVAAYPVDDEESSEVAAYPTPYPVADDEMAAYPFAANDDADDDGADAVAAYPTDEAYPGAEDLAYPVTDSYPVDGEPYGIPGDIHSSEGTEEPYAAAAPKKTVKVDKALVSFVPTNLQSKKRKAEESKGGTSLSAPASAGDATQQQQQKKAKSSEDNYNNFMKEIDGL